MREKRRIPFAGTTERLATLARSSHQNFMIFVQFEMSSGTPRWRIMQQIVSGVFKTHDLAETAVRALGEVGIMLKDVSIVTQNVQTTEQVQGFVTTGGIATTGAGIGAWWGGVFGILVGAAFLWIPGVGPLVVAGSLATSVLATLEGAAVGSAGGVLIGALLGAGLSRDNAIKYESIIRTGRYLVLVQADEAHSETARQVLKRHSAMDLDVSTITEALTNPA